MTAASAPAPTGTAFRAGRMARSALRRRWATPRWLVAFRAAACGCALLLLLVGETTLNRGRAALRVIARETAPSILAAADIGTALVDMDGNVANALLGNASHRAAAEVAIENDRVRVTEGILRAAENNTAGEAERAPLRELSLDLGRYLERQSEARLLHDNGDEGTARERYWTATEVVHSRLLAAADALDATKKAQMDEAYRVQLLANEGSEAVAIGVGALLLGALLWAQWFVARRMRRVFSVPLLGATGAALVLTVYLVRCFSDTREDLRIAKKDAFDSIYALVRARTIAYDANGEESRFLLDASPKRGFEREFRSKVALLTAEPDFPGTAKDELTQANPKARRPVPAYTKGILWDEVRNITFPGEYDAASAMIARFAEYYAIDGRVRALKRQGRDAEAVELGIGTRPDESNASFERFDQALLKALAINQAAFDDATARADAELKRAELLDPGLALLVVVLAWLGIRPRLREYEA